MLSVSSSVAATRQLKIDTSPALRRGFNQLFSRVYRLDKTGATTQHVACCVVVCAEASWGGTQNPSQIVQDPVVRRRPDMSNIRVLDKPLLARR